VKRLNALLLACALLSAGGCSSPAAEAAAYKVQSTPDLVDSLRREASAALQVQTDQLLFDVHIFGTRGAAGLLTVTSGGSISNAQPQVLRVSCAGGGGAFSWVVVGTNSTGYPKAVLTGAATKWWIGARFKIPTITSLVSASRIGVGSLTTGGPQVLMGVVGAVSTTNFAASGANSGVAVDTGFHDHRMWRVNSAGSYKMDTTIVSGVTAAGADSALGVANADLTGEAAARDIDVVYIAVATVRP
jgi:hypothetical protein